MALEAVAVVALWRTLRRWGGAGLVVLGVLDSSLIPTFGSLDILTVVLAAKHKDLWLYYAAMSTLGSLLGGYITYRLGRQAGRVGLEKKLGPKKLAGVQRAFERWGYGAVFVPAVAPPPFPTAVFFIGAGAFGYPAKKFAGAVTLARGLRYGLTAFIAAHYGRRVLRFFRHPERYVYTSVLITVAVVVLVVIVSLLWREWRATMEGRADGVESIGPR